MREKTLAIIKPDAVKKRVIGKIIERIEDEGFTIMKMKLLHLTEEESKRFYIVHKDKHFFESLTEFMSSGEIVVMILEREDAVAHWREVMGATDPALAKLGSIRREFGFSVERNAVHGSDSRATADWEISFFIEKISNG
jgi:nucleoside-diphosphate kinase